MDFTIHEGREKHSWHVTHCAQSNWIVIKWLVGLGGLQTWHVSLCWLKKVATLTIEWMLQTMAAHKAGWNSDPSCSGEVDEKLSVNKAKLFFIVNKVYKRFTSCSDAWVTPVLCSSLTCRHGKPAFTQTNKMQGSLSEKAICKRNSMWGDNKNRKRQRKPQKDSQFQLAACLCLGSLRQLSIFPFVWWLLIHVQFTTSKIMLWHRWKPTAAPANVNF